MSETPLFALPTNLRLYPVAFFLPGERYAELSDLKIPANVQLHANHLLYIKERIEKGDMLLATPILGPDAPVHAIGVYREDYDGGRIAALMDADPAVIARRYVYRIQSALFPSLQQIHVEY